MAQVYKREGNRLREVEKQLAADCDCLAVVTDAEVEVFRTFSTEGRVEAITNGVNLDFFKRPADTQEEQKCVFVGVLNYKPNSDGVIWFCENVWPSVRAKHPAAIFEIVGRDPSPEVLALNQIEGVNVVGPVDDIRPHLWSASAIVTPMLISRGVQNKVLEAFAAERPLVSSVPPLVGLDIELGKHALQAETPDQWVSAIDELFTDENKRTELGKASREWVTAHHRWDVCLEPFSDLLSGEQPDKETLVAAAKEANQA
jgi:sugar transferase (PEP-CTERM/EpsH1 system associated)